MLATGVCNALECLLIHERVAAPLFCGCASVWPRRASSCGLNQTRWRFAVAPAERSAGPSGAAERLWPRILDLTLAVRIVPSLDAAISHIARYGSLHTEVICTQNEEHAQRFVREVCASFVGWNVSTRFNDGGELGLGAEVGISTTKLHAFGPMGLRELCATKFVVSERGSGAPTRRAVCPFVAGLDVAKPLTRPRKSCYVRQK